jgi:hypothetical protein
MKEQKEDEDKFKNLTEPRTNNISREGDHTT